VEGRKFHLRAYVLCVGALSVYFFNEVLLLSAQRPLAGAALSDRAAHLTNTAVASELSDFDEAKCVRLLVPDLAAELDRTRHPAATAPASGAGAAVAGGLRGGGAADAAVAGVLAAMHAVTAELFGAYQGEFSSFQPLPNCFEHFGLDFMVHFFLLAVFSFSDSASP
jgi:hypothetical protein